MPGMIIALYTTQALESVLSEPHRAEMIRYLINHQNEDGGYGLHIEGQSTMFGSVLRYLCSMFPCAASPLFCSSWRMLKLLAVMSKSMSQGHVATDCRSYVSLRILGMAAEHDVTSSARAWVRWQGGFACRSYACLSTKD